MHELALIQGILRICLQQARQEEALSIGSITLEIGELSGASPEAIEFGFQVAKTGSLAHNASLKIELLPAKSICTRCNLTFQGEKALQTCPECSAGLQLIEGRELKVKSMEIQECAKNVVV